MGERDEVVVLVGATATGKTAVSIPLAQMLDAEIISADSRQVYRYMDIGTAKPTREERAAVPHHFVDIREPDEDYNAGLFGEDARAEAARIVARGKRVLVVGGSGLYVQSLIDGFFDGPPADAEFRDRAEERLAREGLGAMLEELGRVDPATRARIDVTKPRRVIRALEVYHATGRPISALQEERKADVPFTSVIFGLAVERNALYRRIEERCDRMLQEGLEEEAAALEARGYAPTLNALNTVGYAEVYACRRGEIPREEMLRLFKQNSRRYAKRQGTWFRKDARVTWVEAGGGRSAGSIAGEIAEQLRRRNRS
jgi:tRNA dimethylallyltransferase